MSNRNPKPILPEHRGHRLSKARELFGVDEPCSQRSITLPDRVWAELDAEAESLSERTGGSKKRVRAQDRIIARLVKRS